MSLFVAESRIWIRHVGWMDCCLLVATSNTVMSTVFNLVIVDRSSAQIVEHSAKHNVGYYTTTESSVERQRA